MTTAKFFKKSLLMSIAAVIVATSAPFTVFAADDRQFFSTNDIIYYSSEKSCVAGSAGSLVTGDGTNPKDKEAVKAVVWGFLLGKTLTPEQTAGLMGNIEEESRFDLSAIEVGSGAGYGLVQWTGGRRTTLEAAAKQQGVAVSSLAFQLEYLFQESNARPSLTIKGISEWEGMKRQTSVRDATLYWEDNFERSADTQEMLEERVVAAQAIFDQFNGKVGATAGAKCGVIDNSSFLATIKSYAWPEYHPPMYITAKPEYVTALNRARAEGRYIGGTLYPGIDCGGFVTTVMFDSKFDETYNYSAKGGNTVSQKTWLDANWQNLGSGSSMDTGTLEAGDVAMLPGHTYVYVGTKGNKPEGFGSVIASASWDERAPMAGTENIAAGNTTWYRKKAPATGGTEAQ